jgi:two-component system, chemotaxis family, CheB/CheR fusion protein
MAPTNTSFPIVGIGASAGGLDAFTRLLTRIPADTGMAFVLVQHMAPQQPSMLASLLSSVTSMPVREAESGTTVKPNHVYVIPPNTLMSIDRGVLHLERRPEGVPRPIDHFFRSLAAEHKSLAIGIVLSGTDSDGATGLQRFGRREASRSSKAKTPQNFLKCPPQPPAAAR